MEIELIERARRLERSIAGRMADAARSLMGRGRTREPIEVLHAVVASIEREVQLGGRGVRLFPFNRVDVSLAASSDHARARLDAIVAGVPSLRDRIMERLETAGCRDVDVDVTVQYVPRPQKHWTDADFSVAFARLPRSASSTPAPSPEPQPRRLDITVLQGAAEQRHYAFTADRVDLGRGSEVRDARHALVRTNHVAFSPASAEGDHTISRQHAHIAWDAQTRTFRVHDDGSVHGTRIQRSGKTVPVPFGSRGVRLQSGDEIVLGAARVKVKM